jgi:hypothetical protein
MGINRGPISALDRVFSDETPVNDDDHIEVRITFDGMDARFVRMEAASRGISPQDMAQILVQQGMFFWSKQT